jgi:hypothetical protein
MIARQLETRRLRIRAGERLGPARSFKAIAFGVSLSLSAIPSRFALHALVLGMAVVTATTVLLGS